MTGANSAITTHVLDTASGRAAAGVRVTLERRAQDGDWVLLDETATDRDGRARLSAREAEILVGAYRLTFYAGAYHQRQGVRGFYPEVVVVFEVRDAAEHYHVPLLLSPHGYSTYRGT